MNGKFFYLYLIAGVLALIILFYQLITPHSMAMNGWNMMGYVLLSGLMMYLAYKTYHMKKDQELM